MKKVLGIILVVALALATMGLTVGCGSEQSDFERAEQMVNEMFDSINELLDSLEAMFDGDDDIDIDEFFERIEEFDSTLWDRFEEMEYEFDALELTDDEEDRLDALVTQREEAAENRLLEMIERVFS